MNQKLLYFTTLLPYPPDMGGKIKTLSTLKKLVKKYEVHLFSFVDKKEDQRYENELLRIGIKKCYTIVHPVIAEKHRIIQIKILLQSIFTDKPYSVYKYYSKQMVVLMKETMEKEKFGTIWIDHTIQTQYLPTDFKGRKILETHNYKTDFFRQMFFADNNLFLKFFSLHEWIKFKFYEPKELAKFDPVYAISEREKKEINKYNSNVKVLIPVIPKTGNKGKIGAHKLFFVGLLTWYPNKQGIEWFIKNVFSELKKIIPDITLDIVGDYSSKWQKPQVEGVKFHGYVRDIRPFWKEASVFIVPIFYGSGIRIKILEAIANGIPVISTQKGAEGLPKIIRNKISVAKDMDEWIKKIQKEI